MFSFFRLRWFKSTPSRRRPNVSVQEANRCVLAFMENRSLTIEEQARMKAEILDHHF